MLCEDPFNPLTEKAKNYFGMRRPGERRRARMAMPRTTKEMVDSLRASAQAGLQARISRMRVEMPDAFEFGVEGGKKKRSKIVTADGIVRSDRELARLFVEMFAGTGLRPLVLFPEASHAEQARRKWASSTEADIRALGGAKKRSKPAKSVRRKLGS